MPPAVREVARAKVNLALHVLGRRADGFHELDSIVAFADVGDVLEISPASTTTLSVHGPFADLVPADEGNLVLRAVNLVRAHTGSPAVSVNLRKVLPVAAGIGGGSSDAAATLRGLIRLFDLSLPSEDVQAMALKLGADVPACLLGTACRMQGMGDRITPLTAPPAGAIVLANPRVACPTADVFRAMGLAPGATAGSAIDVEQPATWRNDMTAAAISIQPAVADVLASLAALEGATAARMSGSGATCFALFPSLRAAHAASAVLHAQHPHLWVAAAALV